jgi:hypothetical protein
MTFIPRNLTEKVGGVVVRIMPRPAPLFLRSFLCLVAVLSTMLHFGARAETLNNSAQVLFDQFFESSFRLTREQKVYAELWVLKLASRELFSHTC